MAYANPGAFNSFCPALLADYLGSETALQGNTVKDDLAENPLD
jgi:hypothetical protein